MSIDNAPLMSAPCCPCFPEMNDDRQTRLLFYIVLAGFMLAYLFCYIMPTYFLGAEKMRFFTDVPALPRIGQDLLGNIDRCGKYMEHKDDLGNIFYFSPLWTGVFGVLSYFDPLTMRWIVLVTSLGCYIAGCLVMPRCLGDGKGISLASVFIMATGLFSYSLRFDLERGQWNLIVLFMCLAAMALWQSPRRWMRWTAYGLFSAAVHLKLWPIVFAVMFFRPGDGWLKNIRRYVWLGIFNVLLLFVLGPSFLFQNLFVLCDKTANPYVWIGNHSIYSFAQQALAQYGVNTGIWLTGLFLACLAGVLLLAWRRYDRRLNGFVILICLLAGSLLPTRSHDYKLAALTVGMSIFAALYRRSAPPRLLVGRLETALLFALFTAYSFTLFSFQNILVYSGRWVLLFANNCPALMLMALCLTGLMVIQSRAERMVGQETQ